MKILQKTHTAKIALFYILLLLLWSVISSTISVSETGEVFCESQECYVNHVSSTFAPMGKTFPSQSYLSARSFSTQETVSTTRGRNIRPQLRSVKNISASLLLPVLFSGILIFSSHLWGQKVLSHCLCGIVITNYLHDQDGSKI